MADHSFFFFLFFFLQSVVLRASFSKFHPNLIVGSTYTGQIVLWDTRAKSQPVQRTPLTEKGHAHPVYALSTVGVQSAHNLITASTDGMVCAWQLDMLTNPQVLIDPNLLHFFFSRSSNEWRVIFFPEMLNELNGMILIGNARAGEPDREPA
jgi:WD40 repeat protein